LRQALPRSPAAWTHALVGAAILALGACSSGDDSGGAAGGGGTGKQVKEIATNVLTLQFGTITDLRAMRGQGPYYDYEVPPAAMLAAAEKAMKSKVVGVYPNPHAMEVVAKERAAKDEWDDRYDTKWLSAAIVIVHPVPSEPGRSKVEIHAIDRGPFHKGRIAWEAELPLLLAQYAATR
jgi:hypothetical protein